MEGHGQGQRERTSSRRRQRRKSKTPRSKVVVEPELIAARRPDSPLLKNGFVVASASPKHSSHFARQVVVSSPLPEGGPLAVAEVSAHPFGDDGDDDDADLADNAGMADDEAAPRNGAGVSNGAALSNGNGAGLTHSGAGNGGAINGSAGSDEKTGVRRRAVRIVKAADSVVGPGNREQQLLDRLVRSQGRGAISRAADDLWEGKFTAPKRQEVQIQLLEHENEHRARDAVFAMAELLQREAPIKRPVLDQRLRRLEQSAEDPITRDAAGALRRSMRVHHGP